MEMQVETFDVVSSWIANMQYSHSKSPKTAAHYREGLEAFTKWIQTTPEAIVKEYETSDEKTYKRKYSQLIRSYISHLSNRGLAPGTISTAIGIVRSFFKYNDLPLSFIPSGSQKVSFHNRDITKEEIEAVLSISSTRDKAFFLLMAQSGLRPHTLCKLRIKDLEPDLSKGVIPCKINVSESATKGGYFSYFTFAGPEAVAAIKAYLVKRPDVKPEDLLFVKEKAHGYPTNERLVPETPSNTFRRKLQQLRKKGVLNYELRQGKKPHELRLYCLRKYFKNHASQMGFEYTEFIMGHSPGVSGHYIAKDPEFYRKLYAEKAMPHLRLGAPTPTEAEKEIEKMRTTTQGQMEAMNAMIGQLQADNKALREEYQGLLKLFNQFKESKKK